jgi:hypothetical protein
VYDLSGKLLYSDKITAPHIDLGSIGAARGVYLVRIQTMQEMLNR